MVETRSAPRIRVTMPAKIEGSGFDVACTVHDLSLTGAAVEIINLDPRLLPSTFMLIMSAVELKLRCRVVWRGAYRVGVAFI